MTLFLAAFFVEEAAALLIAYLAKSFGFPGGLTRQELPIPGSGTRQEFRIPRRPPAPKFLANSATVELAATPKFLADSATVELAATPKFLANSATVELAATPKFLANSATVELCTVWVWVECQTQTIDHVP